MVVYNIEKPNVLMPYIKKDLDDTMTKEENNVNQ